MARGDVIEKILSDAKAEAEAILAEADARAEEIAREAQENAERETLGTKAEIDARKRFIAERNAANIRLETSKILLREKHDVVDGVYEEAYRRMLSLNKEDALRYAERLLLENAEEGDTVCFGEKTEYIEEISRLPVVRERKLKISPARAPIGGGMYLIGEKSDKDLSYRALLARDREEHSAEIAAELFRK